MSTNEYEENTPRGKKLGSAEMDAEHDQNESGVRRRDNAQDTQQQAPTNSYLPDSFRRNLIVVTPVRRHVTQTNLPFGIQSTRFNPQTGLFTPPATRRTLDGGFRDTPFYRHQRGSSTNHSHFQQSASRSALSASPRDRLLTQWANSYGSFASTSSTNAPTHSQTARVFSPTNSRLVHKRQLPDTKEDEEIRISTKKKPSQEVKKYGKGHEFAQEILCDESTEADPKTHDQ